MQLEIMVSLIAGMAIVVGVIIFGLMFAILISVLYSRDATFNLFSWMFYMTMSFIWMLGGIFLQMKFGYPMQSM